MDVTFGVTFGHHFFTKHFYVTFEHHFWTSLLDVTYGRHFYTSLLDVTFKRHFWTSLLDVTFGHHFWTTLLDSYVLVKTALILKPPEVAPWGAGWHNRQHTDIATYTLNRPRSRFNQNPDVVTSSKPGLCQ